jgi:hypothetical protein
MLIGLVQKVVTFRVACFTLSHEFHCLFLLLSAIVRFPVLTIFGLFVVDVILFCFRMVTRFFVDVHHGGKFVKSRKIG